MSFIQISAPAGAPVGEALSADNIPPRHIIMTHLRGAARQLGLSAPVLSTLEAMLSFLPPRRDHHMVFASNDRLAERRNGVTDRTLRRHVAILIEAGLIERHDSANGKRFTRRNPRTGAVLRFGFDLGPLFRRLAELAKLGETARIAREAAHHDRIANSGKARKAAMPVQTATAPAVENPPEIPKRMSASSGRNVRHQKSPKKENKIHAREITLGNLLDACPTARSLSPLPLNSPAAIIDHARRLAPMIGIDENSLGKAMTRFGRLGGAIAIWAMVELHGKIRNARGYLARLVTIAENDEFDPWTLIRRLLAERGTA